MSILVVGGAGYIGSHAVHQLHDRGEKVVIIDNLETGNKQAIHANASFYEGDIRDVDFLHSVFASESIDAVIHFAASSLVGESMENPLKYYDNNVHGTQILLEAMVKYNVKNIVFSSTAATYGEQEASPITEDMATNPANPYGETKRAMERMIEWADKAYGIKYVSLRYFNVAGARQTGEIGEDHDPETHLIPIILQAALNKRPSVTIYGDDYNTPDGTCIRDYIHVEDLIDAHLLALKYLQQGGKSDIFNLGSSQGFSVKELVDTARSITGKEIPAVIGPRRAGDPSTLIASSTKAREILGWNPGRTSIEEIMKDAWNWHLSHPEGYKKEVAR